MHQIHLDDNGNDSEAPVTTTYNTHPADVRHVTKIVQGDVEQTMALISLVGDHPDDPPFYVPADQVCGLPTLADHVTAAVADHRDGQGAPEMTAYAAIAQIRRDLTVTEVESWTCEDITPSLQAAYLAVLNADDAELATAYLTHLWGPAHVTPEQ